MEKRYSSWMDSGGGTGAANTMKLRRRQVGGQSVAMDPDPHDSGANGDSA